MSLPCSFGPSILASTMLWTQRSSVSREVVEIIMCKCAVLFGLWTHNSCANLLNRFADEASGKLSCSFAPPSPDPPPKTHKPHFPTPPPANTTGKTLFKVCAVTERFWSDHPEKMKNENKNEKNSKNTFFHPLQGRAGRYWTASERLKRAVFLDCASQIL